MPFDCIIAQKSTKQIYSLCHFYKKQKLFVLCKLLAVGFVIADWHMLYNELFIHINKQARNDRLLKKCMMRDNRKRC